MLTVTEKNNELLIKCAYAYKDRVKKIPGAFFDFDNKIWKIPKSYLQELIDLFPGEIYFKTPLWKIRGDAEPPKQDIKFFDKPVNVPKLNLEPFEYQKTGIQFAVDRLEKLGFCLIADQMGLGKSLQATGALKWYKDKKKCKRALIICMKSLKYQWASELERYTGWKDIYITGQTPKKRAEAYEAVKSGGVLITNYHNFLNDTDQIKDIDFDLYIIDEAHYLKNKDGVLNNNISSVTKNEKVILMTGTPVMSKPDDIFGITKLATDYFGSYKEFENRFLVIENGIYGRQIIGARNLDLLHKMISEFMIRRTTDDIREDLRSLSR